MKKKPDMTTHHQGQAKVIPKELWEKKFKAIADSRDTKDKKGLLELGDDLLVTGKTITKDTSGLPRH